MLNTIFSSKEYLEEIRAQQPFVIEKTYLNMGIRYEGKVRDYYDLGDRLLLVTTDRLSAFDRPLALIPCKGQVLNLISAWWFEQTADLVPNHLLAVPDANAILARKCQVFPIEFVVRGYITGSTETSLWTQYKKGVRTYCGVTFAEGLRKNQALNEPVLTPTTKDKIQDRPISAEEILAEGLMSEEHWALASTMALKLFTRGTEIAAKNGLILVDTKYEFGLLPNGEVVVVDEIHTPDSSRYWLKESYEDQINRGLEPENIDKEFLRLWFTKNCDPYQDKVLPSAPQELVEQLSLRYIQLYEMITGRKFRFLPNLIEPQERIKAQIANFLS